MTIFKYDLNTIVRTDHELRKIAVVVDFGKIARKYVELKTLLGRKGYGLAVGIMGLLRNGLFRKIWKILSTRGVLRIWPFRAFPHNPLLLIISF